MPAEGSEIGIHWLAQAGDKPDIKVDRQKQHCRLRLVAGRFEPVDNQSRDQLDENIAFEKRKKDAKAYSELVLREIDGQDSIRERLVTAVRVGDVAATLRVLADDLCFWAGNLKDHLLHQVTHLATDPSFVRMMDVPQDAPFQFLAPWVVREWIGSHEAFDLLEFYKSAEYARRFSARLNDLHEARVEFSTLVTQYTVQTRGDDAMGMFGLPAQDTAALRTVLELLEPRPC